MSLTTTARNQALDALVLTQMSLHDGFPGAIGANELTGGGYARQSCTFNVSSGGVRNLSAAANFPVGAGHTVRWEGLWDGTTFQGYSPNGGSPREFQVDTTANTVSVLSHGWSDGDTIVFYGGTIPTGLTEGVIYYVRDATTSTFRVAATAGGSAIDLTGTGGTDCVVSRITESAYGGVDTHTISSWGIGAVF